MASEPNGARLLALKARNSSSELESPSRTTLYNQNTGRPIRKNAGRIRKAAEFIDSSVIEDDEPINIGSGVSDIEKDEATDEETDEEAEADRKKAKGGRKRKQSPSLPDPPSPVLGPVIYDEEVEALTEDEFDADISKDSTENPPITLQFNIPLGFHGPLYVKLDSAMLKPNTEDRSLPVQAPRNKRLCVQAVANPQETIIRHNRKGFTDLPPELRNTIYRHVFIRKVKFDFPLIYQLGQRDHQQSAQFLRVCKLVHSEACSVLYGENKFRFDRTHGTRGPFWVSEPKEIGYQDVLRFLRMIGPENLLYLRDCHFVFDDAHPKDTAYLRNNEDRRFLNDEVLINCLRVLRQARLRKLSLTFVGRRRLLHSNHVFLKYVAQIKADEIVRGNAAAQGYSTMDKLGLCVWDELKRLMTRSKKLYEN